MSEIRISSIKVKNYRSFGEEQSFVFPDKNYKKPVAIVGYNNSGKTNLINAIKYGLYEGINEETFELKDFHKCKWENSPHFETKYSKKIGDIERSYTNVSNIIIIGNKISTVDDYTDNGKSQKWQTKKDCQIFYINFHTIKEQISTKKTSWGNLNSFLAKHIKKLIDIDTSMLIKKSTYETEVKIATDKVLENSKLSEFISIIKRNYSTNLRDNNCEISFGLPDYEDIFLQMIFKIGLNGDNANLIPIDHFGDGYISMFVMAVIQAIAESNTEDKCLFLFEEPESFLHENHQEYFYKTVLCNLSKRGHQVIYTTHSDKMVDIFDTKGIIRIEFDETKKQTVKKYNKVDENKELVTMKEYNNFIKFIEPNLNRILFSRKVILVEGANDILVYKYLIDKYVKSIKGEKYAETYLNFLNIALTVHHGKSTANFLITLCKHLGLDYFAINDLDFDSNSLVSQLSTFTEEEMKNSDLYVNSDKKAMITVNWQLINSAGINRIHFNIPKLETVLGYISNDKNSLSIWEHIKEIELSVLIDKLLSQSLKDFLEFSNLVVGNNVLSSENSTETNDDDLPL
jgi:putative ATP-dependent endonuclease of OLD family